VHGLFKEPIFGPLKSKMAEIRDLDNRHDVINIMLRAHARTITASTCLSLLLSFTPGSKPTFSTNPSHRRFLLPTGLPHDNGTGPDLLYSSFNF